MNYRPPHCRHFQLLQDRSFHLPLLLPSSLVRRLPSLHRLHVRVITRPFNVQSRISKTRQIDRQSQSTPRRPPSSFIPLRFEIPGPLPYQEYWRGSEAYSNRLGPGLGCTTRLVIKTLPHCPFSTLSRPSKCLHCCPTPWACWNLIYSMGYSERTHCMDQSLDSGWTRGHGQREQPTPGIQTRKLPYVPRYKQTNASSRFAIATQACPEAGMPELPLPGLLGYHAASQAPSNGERISLSHQSLMLGIDPEDRSVPDTLARFKIWRHGFCPSTSRMPRGYHHV